MGLFDTPPLRSVGRTVLIGSVWSIVLVIIGAALVGVVALIAGGIALVTSEPAVEQMADAARVAGWVVGSLAVVVLVWVVAYVSTGWRFRAKALLGGFAGLGIAVAYVLLGSLGGPFAGLAVGWGIVIPAERPVRIAARAVPAIVTGVFAPGIGSAGPGLLVGTALLSAWIAALFVYLGDGVWTVVQAHRDDDPAE